MENLATLRITRAVLDAPGVGVKKNQDGTYSLLYASIGSFLGLGSVSEEQVRRFALDLLALTDGPLVAACVKHLDFKEIEVGTSVDQAIDDVLVTGRDTVTADDVGAAFNQLVIAGLELIESTCESGQWDDIGANSEGCLDALLKGESFKIIREEKS